MKPNFFKILPFLALWLIHCSGGVGGTEAGNPPDLPTRNVIGSLQATDVNLNAKTLVACPADTVIATNSSGTAISADIDNDCSFTLTLTTGQAYVLSLLNDGSFIANFIFNNSPTTLGALSFVLSAGSTDVTLGLITLSGTNAMPEFEPAEQCDSDDDGVNDFDDDDDDNDGTGDDDERDCDLDGFFDDHDDDDCGADDSEEDEDGNLAAVLEVSPRSQETGVNLDEDIEVRTGCPINPATVDATTFLVEDAAEVAIACTFDTDEDETVCEHDDFDASTQYTVTLDGIECQDGTPISAVMWSFTTNDD